MRKPRKRKILLCAYCKLPNVNKDGFSHNKTEMHQKCRWAYDRLKTEYKRTQEKPKRFFQNINN